MNQSYYSGFGQQSLSQSANPYSVLQKPSVSLAEYARKTYGWMCIGLLVTFGISLLFLWNQEAAAGFIVSHTPLFHIAMVAEIVVVFVLGLFVSAIPPAGCRVLFLVYSALNGLVFAPVLMIYGLGNCVVAFAATAGIFGLMTLYGLLTKRDLSDWKHTLLIGLFGLLVFTVIAMIFRLPLSDLLISLAGIALFIGFTAVDTQKIRHYYQVQQGNDSLLQKSSIVVALDLYLDFVNLFLYLLRLFARES